MGEQRRLQDGVASLRLADGLELRAAGALLPNGSVLSRRDVARYAIERQLDDSLHLFADLRDGRSVELVELSSEVASEVSHHLHACDHEVVARRALGPMRSTQPAWARTHYAGGPTDADALASDFRRQVLGMLVLGPILGGVFGYAFEWTPFSNALMTSGLALGAAAVLALAGMLDPLARWKLPGAAWLRRRRDGVHFVGDHLFVVRDARVRWLLSREDVLDVVRAGPGAPFVTVRRGPRSERIDLSFFARSRRTELLAALERWRRP